VSASPPRSRIVAIIEDDPAMLSGLNRMLSAAGFATESFTSAEEFLAQPIVAGTRCLIVDINLGGVSGIEMARRLNATGRSIPVVFITARDDEATHRDADSVGYAAYLRKPFAGQVLIDAINRATCV
jgi:FixJ family two-component response regulator